MLLLLMLYLILTQTGCINNVKNRRESDRVLCWK